MNGNDRYKGRVALWAFSALAGVLTGCTTYVEPPRPAPVYVAPAPAPVEAPMPVQTVVEIRVERDFYEPLRPYGHWIEVADYGRCWVPDRVDRNWRPYTNGHWERTEAGWYWVSDEPFGWATYHYGRWDWRPELGWLWVPQTQWAPAWVSFRQGGGYMGWAPLHPSARFHGDRLEESVRPDREQGLVFVEERRFLEPVRPTTVVVNNTTIINRTVNITNIKVVNNTIINEGPRVAVIEKASGRAVRAVPVRELRRRQEATVVAQPVPSANQNTSPAAGRPANDSRDNNVQAEAERRNAERLAQAKAEAERKAKAEAERKAKAEAEREAKETAAKAAQAEAARRAEAAKSRTEAEAQRKAKEAELRAAQAEAQRQTNAARMQAQAEEQRKAKEARLKAAQAETERRTNEARAKAESRKSATTRGEDAITSRIAAAFAADPTLQGVHVVRSNGVVHLSGSVSSADQKRRAGEIAKRIETAHPIRNNLTVSP